MNRLLAFCLTSLFFFAGTPHLQQALAQTSTGVLRGQVADPSGAVIPQASLTVTSTAGVSRTGTSDAMGQYAITGLAPGPIYGHGASHRLLHFYLPTCGNRGRANEAVECFAFD